MTRVLCFLAFFFMTACGSKQNHAHYSIGIDPSFSLGNVGEKGDYLEGFIDEFLLTLSQQSGKNLEKVITDQILLQKLEQQKIDAVISSIEPYNYNEAKYDFSDPIVNVGLVLVIPKNSSATSLESLDKGRIGFHEDFLPPQASLELPKKAVVKSFSSYPDLLNALETKDIEGAVLSRMQALSFLSGSFSNQLKIAEKPISQKALRMVTLKGKNGSLLRYCNEVINKPSILKKLLKKWEL